MEYNYDSLIINDMPKKFYKEEHQLSYYISNKEVSIIDAYIHYTGTTFAFKSKEVFFLFYGIFVHGSY